MITFNITNATINNHSHQDSDVKTSYTEDSVYLLKRIEDLTEINTRLQANEAIYEKRIKELEEQIDEMSARELNETDSVGAEILVKQLKERISEHEQKHEQMTLKLERYDNVDAIIELKDEQVKDLHEQLEGMTKKFEDEKRWSASQEEDADEAKKKLRETLRHYENMKTDEGLLHEIEQLRTELQDAKDISAEHEDAVNRGRIEREQLSKENMDLHRDVEDLQNRIDAIEKPKK